MIILKMKNSGKCKEIGALAHVDKRGYVYTRKSKNRILVGKILSIESSAVNIINEPVYIKTKKTKM